jgi:glycosyltransferase involved in cell wall biosynthesis
MKPRLIVVGPVPPPYHGVTVSTTLVLGNPILKERFDVEHLDTSDHRPAKNTGRWDRDNVKVALRNVARLAWQLRGPRGLMYVPLSQNRPALFRDSIFIGLASARRWKIAGHLRGSEFREFFERQQAVPRRLIRSSLRRIDSLAVMGESLRWVFEGLVAAERIAVVQNGTPDPQVNGAVQDPETVLFLSNLRRRKGVSESLDAALIVLAEYPGARFLFVGEWEDDELERVLKQRAEQAAGRVEFRSVVTGAAKDELLASSGVLLFPPIEPEGHPRVVLEALAAGLPVITTDRGAIAETVVDGSSGFVLDDPEPEALADRLLRLLRDPALRQRMGDAARARYAERFTQAAADRQIADWLLEIAGS